MTQYKLQAKTHGLNDENKNKTIASNEVWEMKNALGQCTYWPAQYLLKDSNLESQYTVGNCLTLIVLNNSLNNFPLNQLL